MKPLAVGNKLWLIHAEKDPLSQYLKNNATKSEYKNIPNE